MAVAWQSQSVVAQLAFVAVRGLGRFLAADVVSDAEIETVERAIALGTAVAD